MSSIVSKHYDCPEGCLEVIGRIIKKSDLELSDNFFTQIQFLENKYEVNCTNQLEAHRLELKDMLGQFEEQFCERLAHTINELKEHNDKLFNAVENVCADVCKDVLTQIGAEMSAQEKVNILISEALAVNGKIEVCTISIPPDCSLPESIIGNAELWEIKEDNTLKDGEIVIDVGLGKIIGDFNTTFKKHIDSFESPQQLRM